jgi:hypothetical protein
MPKRVFLIAPIDRVQYADAKQEEEDDALLLGDSTSTLETHTRGTLHDSSDTLLSTSLSSLQTSTTSINSRWWATTTADDLLDDRDGDSSSKNSSSLPPRMPCRIPSRTEPPSPIPNTEKSSVDVVVDPNHHHPQNDKTAEIAEHSISIDPDGRSSVILPASSNSNGNHDPEDNRTSSTPSSSRSAANSTTSDSAAAAPLPAANTLDDAFSLDALFEK